MTGATPALAVALALVLDAAVAEPPGRLHPVAWFGSVVAAVDREWSRPQLAGVAVAALAPAFATVAVALAVALAGRVHPLGGVVAAGLAVFTTTSLRMLCERAAEVVAATETDLPAARERLRWLVGRDAEALSAGEVRSAAVESAAENLADGVVAPLLAFALLAPTSLALGAGAAAWVKAVNTLDSMLGYPGTPHGTASARLDDAVMWAPARVSAGLVALAALAPTAVSAARAWADAPPSPNSGWPMATLAAVLDARLEKPGVYVLNPDVALPSVESSRTGIRVVAVAGVLAYLLAAGLASLLAGIGAGVGGGRVVLTALRGALGFLTRLPTGGSEAAWSAFRTTPAAFGAVGWVVGALAAVPLLVATRGGLPAPTAAFGYLLALYGLTGINHADGVADLGDAAVVHGDREDRRTVLKDTEVGVGAVVALGLVVAGLALGALALARLPTIAAVAVAVAAEVGAKVGMAALACLGEPAFEGLGSAFTDNDPAALAGPALVASPVVLLGAPAVAGLTGAFAVAVALLWWSRANLGGVNGDVFGATNELGRVVGLHAGVIAWTLC